MSQEPLGFSQRMITIMTGDIDGDILNYWPVGSRIECSKGSLVFSKNHIFDPVQ